MSPGLVKSLLQLVSAANRLALPGSPGPNLAVGGPDGEILRTLLTADLLYRPSYADLPLQFRPPKHAGNMWIVIQLPGFCTFVIGKKPNGILPNPFHQDHSRVRIPLFVAIGRASCRERASRGDR